MECPDCGREIHPYTWPDICPHCHAFLCDESMAEAEREKEEVRKEKENEGRDRREENE